MLSLRAVAEHAGVSGARALGARLKSGETSLRHLIQAAEIHRTYQSLGGFRSLLGTRMSSPSFALDGSARGNFRGGFIRLQADGTREARHKTVLRIRFRGFECLDHSTGPGSEEPYFILSVLHPQVQLVHLLGRYEDVDEGDAIAGDAILIDGVTPEITAVSIVVREHDAGSEEEAKQKVLEKVREIGSAIASAYALSEGIDSGGAELPDWTKLPGVDLLAEGFVSIFGLADDQVGSHTAVFLDFRDGWTDEKGEWRNKPILGKFQGNNYNWVSPVIGSGAEGQYRVYLLVELIKVSIVIDPLPE